MKTTKPKRVNYAALKGDGKYPPRLFCPVCGEAIILRRQHCPHVLFMAVSTGMERAVKIDYVRRQLTKIWGNREQLEKVLSKTCPANWIRKLNLNPHNTLLLSLENNVANGSFSAVLNFLAAFEFPSRSKTLKQRRRLFKLLQLIWPVSTGRSNQKTTFH